MAGFRFPVASYKTMKQSDNVIVLGAGPSLNKLNKSIIKWRNDKKALVIGAHYQYLIRPNYTVFSTPAKFRRSQGRIPGKYIIGPRIKRVNVKKKYYKKIIRMLYSKTKFLEWKSEELIIPPSRIPYDGAGSEAMIVSLFCNPTNLLFVGFDGYEIHNGKLIIKHARNSTVVKPKKSIDKISKKKTQKTLVMETKRRKSLYRLFKYITNENINMHIFEQDKFRGLDKNRLSKEFNFTIL